MPTVIAILLADASAETWVAVGSAAVATIGTIFAGLFGYLGSKDRNRIGALEEKADECEEHRGECEEKLKETEKELKARDERDRSLLQKQIDDLRAESRGKTPGKTPEKE